MIKKNKIAPYIGVKNGKLRFMPGEKLRKIGYKSHYLLHEDGRHFSVMEAQIWVRNLLKEAENAENQRNKTGKKPQKQQKTLFFFTDFWLKTAILAAKTGKFSQKFSENTRNSYFYAMRQLQKSGAPQLAKAAESLKRADMRALYEFLLEKHSESSAAFIMSVLSTAFSWGILNGKLKMADNPCRQTRIRQNPVRLRIASREEIEALIKAADSLNLPGIGDIILCAVATGQRQQDRFAAGAECLRAGRFVIKQQKRGAIVSVPITARLRQRLAAAMARTSHKNSQNLLFLNETSGKKWQKHSYFYYFRLVRAKAAGEVPSVADIRDQDLRDTSITWLAQAGATVPEIVAVSGHSLQNAARILRHYLAATPEMADSAIKKLEKWL